MRAKNNRGWVVTTSDNRYGGDCWDFTNNLQEALVFEKKSYAQNAMANHYGWAMRNTDKREDNLFAQPVKRVNGKWELSRS